ncbi:MAG: hypothetical protein QGH66_05980, partial [Dehalococcoidia bacterium]|nr:hypothetical protein [Dehalococcoidia bacterium]
HEVFLPGTRTDVIVKYVQERMAERANCGSHR